LIPANLQGFFGSKKPPATAASPQKKQELIKSKLKAAQARLKKLVTRLKKPDGAILEEQSADAKEYEALCAQIASLSAQGGVPAGPPAQPWSIFSRSLRWQSDAERDVKVVKQLNAKITQIAKKVKGKALPPDLAQQCEATVNKLVKQIESPDLKGKPVKRWADIAATLKGSQAEADKAEADKLEQQLKKDVLGLKSILKMVTGTLFGGGGVTEDEAKEKKAQFEKSKAKAQKLWDTLRTKYKRSPAALPDFPDASKIKLVSPETAAKKYIKAIEKIDAQLTRKTALTKMKAVSEKKRLSLIAQREGLEKKVAAFGPNAAKLVPPKPRQAYKNQFDAPDDASTASKAPSANNASTTAAGSGTSRGDDGDDTPASATASPAGKPKKKSPDDDDEEGGNTASKPGVSNETSQKIVINVGDSHKGTDPATTQAQQQQQQPGFFTRALTPSPMGMGGMMAGGMMMPGAAPGMMPGMMPAAMPQAGPTINIMAPGAALPGAAMSGMPTSGEVNSGVGGSMTAASAVPSQSDFPDINEAIRALTGLTGPTMRAPFADLITAAGGSTTSRPKRKASAHTISNWRRATTPTQKGGVPMAATAA